MKTIKKITLLFSILFITICCNKSKLINSDNPIGVEISDEENPKLTLLNVVKDTVFNPKGYYLLIDRTDKYGYTKWE